MMWNNSRKGWDMTTRVESIRFRCDICGVKYTVEDEAKLCEVRGVVLPRFVSGDVVTLSGAEVQSQGLTCADVLVDTREFVSRTGPSHKFATVGHGVRYHVRARGGQKLIVEAAAIVTDMNDIIYCPDWRTFIARAENGRPNDTEGLDSLRVMLNNKLDLGL